MRLFETAWIGRTALRNRIIRSATFEGACDARGNPTPAYQQLYARLADGGLGALITGFVYISADGRAMHPGQAGLESDTKVERFRPITAAVHRRDCPIFVQLAHAGRQTTSKATGGPVYGPSVRPSPYFRSAPVSLDSAAIQRIVTCFAEAARRAREAGFDGVQLHAAHGYLIHQFLQPAMNDRTDEFGIDRSTGQGTTFLGAIIEAVRSACGTDYPLLVKVSAGGSDRQFIRLIRYLDAKKVDAIEVSFGTMDRPFDIFRAESIPVQAILDFNPRYCTRNPVRRLLWRWFVGPGLKRQFKSFTPAYNLPAACLARQHTQIPIISVGGFRSGSEIRQAIEQQGIDFVSLGRPLLCEPDFVVKIQRDPQARSRCSNCNRCAVMCDSGHPTRCYGRRATSENHSNPLDENRKSSPLHCSGKH